MILLLLLVLLLSIAPTDEALTSELIYPDAVETIWWSNDSQHLVFFAVWYEGEYQTMTLTSAAPLWYSYDVMTGELTNTTTFPLQPDVADSDLEAMQPLADAYFYVTPSGDILYPWRVDESDNPPNELALWDGEGLTGTGIPLEGAPIPDPRLFHILWSDDRSAFTVTHFCCVYGPSVRIEYARVDPYERVEFAYTPLTDERQFYTGGVQPFLDGNRAHDLSADGERVLISAQEIFPAGTNLESYNRALLIWNSRAPDTSLIFDTLRGVPVQSASFAHDDESRLLLLEVVTLNCYDITTDSIIRSSETDNEIYTGLFSPDGRWLAYMAYDGVRLADVSDYCAI
jgi:hypothetical protein